MPTSTVSTPVPIDGEGNYIRLGNTYAADKVCDSAIMLTMTLDDPATLAREQTLVHKALETLKDAATRGDNGVFRVGLHFFRSIQMLTAQGNILKDKNEYTRICLESLGYTDRKREGGLPVGSDTLKRYVKIAVKAALLTNKSQVNPTGKDLSLYFAEEGNVWRLYAPANVWVPVLPDTFLNKQRIPGAANPSTLPVAANLRMVEDLYRRILGEGVRTGRTGANSYANLTARQIGNDKDVATDMTVFGAAFYRCHVPLSNEKQAEFEVENKRRRDNNEAVLPMPIGEVRSDLLKETNVADMLANINNVLSVILSIDSDSEVEKALNERIKSLETQLTTAQNDRDIETENAAIFNDMKDIAEGFIPDKKQNAYAKAVKASREPEVEEGSQMAEAVEAVVEETREKTGTDE